MAIGQARSLRFITDTTLAVDTNDNSSNFTTTVNIKDATSISLQVVGATGTHATHVITLQTSNDGSNFVDSSSTVTGEGILENVAVSAAYARGSVTTAEGAASTSNVILVAK